MFILVALFVAAFVYFGVYNVAATRQHNALTYHFLRYAMQRSVKARASSLRVPDLSSPERMRNGFILYREHCLQCHGAPGVAPNPLGFGTRPEPVNLVEAGREWPAAEVYWVVKNGLKMTAMPAWEYRLNDQSLWDLTAFVKLLPTISPSQYKAENNALQLTKILTSSVITTNNDDGKLGDPKAGQYAIEQYLCTTCHAIPGVVGANGTVGPPLRGIATRKYIGGVLPNTPQNMMSWLRNPQQIDPLAAMPDLHIKEKDIHDISAYLYTLNQTSE